MSRIRIVCAPLLALGVAACSLIVDPRRNHTYGPMDSGGQRDGGGHGDSGTSDASMGRDGGPPHDSGTVQDSGPSPDAEMPHDASMIADAGTDAGACATTCTAPTPVCDPSSGTCVACLADTDCDDGDPCTTDRCALGNTCTAIDIPTCLDEITAGLDHACARTRGGTVFCWGSNGFGELGDGTTMDRTTAVMTGEAPPARVAVDVAAGENVTCAATDAGIVHCWGASYSSMPEWVMGVTDAVQVCVGGSHRCARLSSGAVKCWGTNGNGQLGDGTGTGVGPVMVSGLTDATDVACGDRHSCAVRSTGAVVCWGGNFAGQLGDGTTMQRLAPVAVSGISDAIMVAAQASGSCALHASGHVSCWGFGQLTPAPVSAITTAVEVEVGCARLEDGTAACWDPVAMTVPLPVEGLTAAQLTIGGSFKCALDEFHTALCWGSNSSGQLGDGTMTDRTSPVPVMGL